MGTLLLGLEPRAYRLTAWRSTNLSYKSFLGGLGVGGWLLFSLDF